ncbi:MAG: porin family protein [bacterium]|nr:porin family protein [bacterium]
MKKPATLIVGLLLSTAACISPGASTVLNAQENSMAFDPVVYPETIGGLVTNLGITEMVTDDWAPFEHPTFIGVGYLQRMGVDPLELEIGFNYNHDVVGGGSSPEQRLRFFVVDLGLGIAVPLTKSKNNAIEPYAGAGLAFLFARRDEEVGLDVEHFRDGDQGYYMHAGVRLHVEGGQYISLDWRWLRDLEVDLGRGLQSAESNTLSVGFGYSF